MSIALERGSGRMEAAGIVRGVSCIAVFEAPGAGGDRSPPAAAAPLRKVEGAAGAAIAALGWAEEEEVGEEEATSCSSSIGRNSDSSRRSAGSDGEDAGEAEVQSALKGSLDTTGAMEEALPIRRGISKFYSGKSKSFASLADISSASSAKDLGKPENAYTRKRKSLLAFSINWDRRHCSPLRSAAGGSVSKRPANSSRTAAAAADGSSADVGRDLPRLRPPLHPNNGKISPPQRCHFSVRSFSLMDLQGATASSTPSSIIPNDELHRQLH